MPANTVTKQKDIQNIANAYNAYKNYAAFIGQFTPIQNDDEYYALMNKPNKTYEELKKFNDYKPNVDYYTWSKSKKSSSNTPETPASASAPTTPAEAPAIPALEPAKAPATPKAPAPQAKPKVDTIMVDEYFKKGGNKFDKGGVVKSEKSKQTNHVRTTYEDGTVEITDEAGNIISTTTAAKKEGVPPMSYKPDMNPILGETHSQWAGRNSIPGGGWNGAALANKVWDGKQWVDPAGTTTPAATTGEMSAEEKAVRDFAIAKGQNPDEVWQNYQMITSSYGTMGAGTQQPYGYGVSGMVPYRYKHRGYGPIGWDRGYVPGVGDLAAMQEQANRMGYEFYGKSRPTLFGGRKVVIKTKYNPSTGKVERAPEVENEAPAFTEPTTNNEPVREDFTVPRLEVAEGFKQGGLTRFLPKAQAGMMTPKGTFAFDNLDINIPIMDTFHDIKTGLTSIKDFKQQRADARREK